MASMAAYVLAKHRFRVETSFAMVVLSLMFAYR